jgi:hypothetical protein
MVVRRPPLPEPPPIPTSPWRGLGGTLPPTGGPQPVAPVFPPMPTRGRENWFDQFQSVDPIRELRKPRKDLLQWLRRKKGGIGGLRRKLLNVPFFEGRQFPRGIPEQFRQLPFGPQQQLPMTPWNPPTPEVINESFERMRGWPLPTEINAPVMPPIPTGPELIPIQQEVRGMDRFTPEQIEAMKNQYMSTMPVGPAIPFQPLPEEMPMPSLTPEEITQQRIDQVSQFEQEPMMGARYGPFGGYAGGGIAELLRYYGR